jgi:hypothetical protein
LWTGGVFGCGGGSSGGGCGCNSTDGPSLTLFFLVGTALFRKRRVVGPKIVSAGFLALLLSACQSPAPVGRSTAALDGATYDCFDAGCGDTQIDPSNCGSCGAACNLAFAVPGCVLGACTVSSCLPGHSDQDGLASNGCETSCPGSDGGLEVCDGLDNDCNGEIDEGFFVNTDPKSCGLCGTVCGAGFPNAVFSCDGGCQFEGCTANHYDFDSTQTCKDSCTFVSAQESCNGVDDNCDGQVDEGVVAPSPAQVCGVSVSAQNPECTSGVGVACLNGSWKCTFPTGVCDPTCALTAEICDNLDNNCNGLVNENVANYGKLCASDDGLAMGHGGCRVTGTMVCNGNNAVKCSAVKASCLSLPGNCVESCDGIDNDCDGTVDENYLSKGTDPAYFVKPDVVKIGAAKWIFKYEASRPQASAVQPGVGNGYTCISGPCSGGTPVAPAGVTLDKTLACSKVNVMPWANATPIEAEQACVAQGGYLCSTADWQTACTTNPPSGTTCAYGYASRGTACLTSFVAGTRFCNLGPSFDADQNASNGDQDGVLETGSIFLKNCNADWIGLYTTASGTGVYDITGNLREITKLSTSVYPLMGGSNLTASEAGAACQFSAYIVDQNFQFADTGFRCCFTADPTQ